MAEGDTRTTDTGKLLLFSYRTKLNTCLALSLLRHYLCMQFFVQWTGMYNIINKEMRSIGSAHVFCIHLVIFKK